MKIIHSPKAKEQFKQIKLTDETANELVKSVSKYY